MDPLVLSSLISGGTSLLSGLFGFGAQHDIAQEELELQKLAQEEQRRLNDFQIREYLNKKDYDRALQQRIFEREDTAMQRSLQDFTEAGFSPLSALRILPPLVRLFPRPLLHLLTLHPLQTYLVCTEPLITW